MRTIMIMMSALIASSAHSQDMPVFQQSMSWPEVATMNQFGVIASQSKDRSEDPRGTQSSLSRGMGPSSAMASKAAIESLQYRPSLTRRSANLARFAQKSQAVDPAGAAKMQALFASTDIIGMIDQKMQATYGMRANNVADAYAVWWVSAWMGAKGRSDDATPGQMAMVKRQATNALAATPEFTAATDAGKQEMAEALLVQAALIGDTIDTYKSDPAMLVKTRAAIAKGAKVMGLDLDTMTLTDQGFVPAKKTGAAAPEPGTPEQALAASDSTPAAPSYVLIAAAGGAGIGGVLLLGKMMGRRG